MLRLCIFGWGLLATALVLCGCKTQPIANSLLDITAESRVIPLREGFWGLGTSFEHHQLFSVNGLIHIPDVGLIYHSPAGATPTSAIGLASGQSYRLIGESEVPDSDRVENVRRNLEEILAFSTQADTFNAEIAQIRAKLENLSDTNRSNSSAQSALITNLTNDLDGFVNRRNAAISNLTHSEALLRTNANHPGIVIARWRARDERGVFANAPTFGSAGLGGRGGKEGFVILGGIRFVSLTYGEDFWQMFNNLRDHERKYIARFGISTFLLQANDVAYVAVDDFNLTNSIGANFSLKKINVPQSLEVQAALNRLSRFENAGNLGEMKWIREPYCFVCGADLPELTDTNSSSRTLAGLFGAQTGWADKTRPGTTNSLHSYQSWRTIFANVTYPKKAFTNKKLWEKYEQARPMHGAATCPYCRGTCTNIAAVCTNAAHLRPVPAARTDDGSKPKSKK